MFYLLKFSEISIILGVTYIWNKFALKKVATVINDENDNESENKFSSFNFLLDNFNFLKYTSYFYWFIAIIVSILLVIN